MNIFTSYSEDMLHQTCQGHYYLILINLHGPDKIKLSRVKLSDSI